MNKSVYVVLLCATFCTFIRSMEVSASRLVHVVFDLNVILKKESSVWGCKTTEIEEATTLLTALKESCTLYLIAQTTKSAFDTLKKNHATLLQTFGENILLTCNVHKSKTNLQLYEHFFETKKIEPSQTIFIETDENVKNALINYGTSRKQPTVMSVLLLENQNYQTILERINAHLTHTSIKESTPSSSENIKPESTDSNSELYARDTSTSSVDSILEEIKIKMTASVGIQENPLFESDEDEKKELYSEMIRRALNSAISTPHPT